MKREVSKANKSGIDVETPSQFANAMVRYGSVSNAVVLLGKIVELAAPEKGRNWIPQIKKLNTFEFDVAGLTAFRHGGIGHGKLIRVPCIEPPSAFECDIIIQPGYQVKFDAATAATHCKPLKGKLIRFNIKKCGEKKVHPESPKPRLLFPCPIEVCASSFIRPSDLKMHIEAGKCKIPLKRATTAQEVSDFTFSRFRVSDDDSAMASNPSLRRSFASRFEDLDETKLSPEIEPIQLVQMDISTGHALQEKKVPVSFIEKQEGYLKKLFKQGVGGKKVKPEIAASMMRKARTNDGKLLFKDTEWLKPSQIRSLFAKYAAQAKSGKPLVTEADIEEAEQEQAAEEKEEAMKDLEEALERAEHGSNFTEHPLMVRLIQL